MAHFATWPPIGIALLGAGIDDHATGRLDARDMSQTRGSWWIHAMALTWLVFTLKLLDIEPLFLDKLLI